MILEQYSLLAEIIAAIAVVASLVYVARQLQQNTEAVRADSANTLLQLTVRMAGDVAVSREVGEYWVKAGEDFGSLDRVDQQRAILFEYRAIQGWSHFYRLREQGMMPDEQWQELVWFIENLGGRRQVIREAWKLFKEAYPKPFQDFLSPYLENG